MFTALRATEQVRAAYERSGPADLRPLAPAVRLARRGRHAPKVLPFVFAAMGLLVLAGGVERPRRGACLSATTVTRR